MFPKIPIWFILSRNCVWLASDFLWAFGEFPGDDEFCSSAVETCYFMGYLAGAGVSLSLKANLSVYLQKCAEIIVAHLGYLNYTQYTVIVGFEHLKLPIKGMNFTVSIPADCTFPWLMF